MKNMTRLEKVSHGIFHVLFEKLFTKLHTFFSNFIIVRTLREFASAAYLSFNLFANFYIKILIIDGDSREFSMRRPQILQ